MGRCIVWALIAFWVIVGSSARATVTVSQEEYHGWSGAYRLSNGKVDLVFVPQIGRIMRYGLVGERNVLWENPALAGKTTDLKSPDKGWQNYGGDKLWPSPQSVWGWPPDLISDSGPQKVSVTANKYLLVTGMESRKYGIRFQREIALDATGTGVTIRNRMTNMSGGPVTWGIWEVAQVDSPEETRFQARPQREFPEGYRVFPEQRPAEGQVAVKDGMVTIRRRSDHSGKIGTRVPGGWIEAQWEALRFRISGEFPKSGDYPDGGCAQEIYTSDDPNRYVEMELLAPMHKIRAGAAVSFVTHWSLARTP